MTIQIENYREAGPMDKHIATFDVYLPNIQCRYRYLTLRRGKHGHFVSFQAKMVEEDGQKKFYPYIEYSPERQKELLSKIMEAIKPFVMRTPNNSPTENLFSGNAFPF